MGSAAETRGSAFDVQGSNKSMHKVPKSGSDRLSWLEHYHSKSVACSSFTDRKYLKNAKKIHLKNAIKW